MFFFSPWHFFLCPWQFSQKCPWHRKNARDNFGPKKVAVTFFWVPVTKIAKMCPWREILAVTNFDIKLKVPVTLKKVPVTFFAVFFSTNSYSLLIRYFSTYWLELYEGGVPYFWTAHNTSWVRIHVGPLFHSLQKSLPLTKETPSSSLTQERGYILH